MLVLSWAYGTWYGQMGIGVLNGFLRHSTQGVYKEKDFGVNQATGLDQSWTQAKSGFADLRMGYQYQPSSPYCLGIDFGIMPSFHTICITRTSAITGTLDNTETPFKHDQKNLKFIMSQNGLFPVFSRFKRAHALTQNFALQSGLYIAFNSHSKIQPFFGAQLLCTHFLLTYQVDPLPPIQCSSLSKEFAMYKMGIGLNTGVAYKVSPKIDIILSASVQNYAKDTRRIPVIRMQELTTDLIVTHYPRYWTVSCAVRFSNNT